MKAFVLLLLAVSTAANTPFDDCERILGYNATGSDPGLGHSSALQVTAFPLFKHLGRQNVFVQNKLAVVMNETLHEQFCHFAARDEQKQLTPMLRDKVLFVPEKFSQTCNGTLGSFTRFTHFNHWCDLEATIIWTNDLSVQYNAFIGYYFKQHDGNKFRSQYAKHESLKSCVMFETEATNELKLDLFRLDPLDTVDFCGTREQNDIFDSVGNILLFRVFLPSLFLGIGLRCVYYLYLDYLNGFSLSNVHRTVLVVNGSTLGFLGILEALGSHFMFDTIGVMFQEIAFFLLFGTSVATDFLLSVLYERVLANINSSRTKFEQRVEKLRLYLFFGFAGMITMIDAVSAFYQVEANQDVYEIVYEKIPVAFITCQLAVNVYLIYQANKLITFFHTSAKLLKEGEKFDATKQLARRFKRWVPISVFCASVSVLMWLLWRFEVLTKQKEAWMLLWCLMILSKLGNVAAQVEVCVPPERRKASHDHSSTSAMKEAEDVVLS